MHIYNCLTKALNKRSQPIVDYPISYIHFLPHHRQSWVLHRRFIFCLLWIFLHLLVMLLSTESWCISGFVRVTFNFVLLVSPRVLELTWSQLDLITVCSGMSHDPWQEKVYILLHKVKLERWNEVTEFNFMKAPLLSYLWTSVIAKPR